MKKLTMKNVFAKAICLLALIMMPLSVFSQTITVYVAVDDPERGTVNGQDFLSFDVSAGGDDSVYIQEIYKNFSTNSVGERISIFAVSVLR